MKMTPMLEQYLGVKAEHPDAILFFRMGDFYEMFFEDAVLASKEIGLTLTARNKGEPDEIPMAGVPFRAADGYVAKLVGKGFNVAICDQLEEPSKTKKIVRRGVTRVVTPGVVGDADIVEDKAPNYLAAVYCGRSGADQSYALAYLDASTGEFKATELGDLGDLVTELSRVSCRELLVPESQREIFGSALHGVAVADRDWADEQFDRDTVLDAITAGDTLDSDMTSVSYFVDKEAGRDLFVSLEEPGFRVLPAVEKAVAGVLSYLIYTQRGVGTHIREVVPYRVEDFLVIDDSTRANLELTETLMGGRRRGSLLSVIDKTVTAMGGRQLRSWLAYPLVDVERIERRLDAVAELTGDLDKREALRHELSNTYDIERLTSKVTSGLANARDLLALSRTLEVVPQIRRLLSGSRADLLGVVGERMDPCADLSDLLGSALVDDPPVSVREGGLFREGFNAELDELIELTRDGKDWLLQYEAQLRDDTTIGSLKVKYNKVFGYFIEVTKANLHLVPDAFIRKQTLANAERYFTEELKEYEEQVLGAEDRRVELEYKLFEELRRATAQFVGRLAHTAFLLATLDVLTGLAEVANRYDYCRPVIDDGELLVIEDGRHPVVERMLDGERFVPNGVELDCTDNQLLVITGPNMAGKSTVIRQVALIALMAQMGSFVPARAATIGVCDKIFSRVGASDNLAKGQSTFMVEMTETAHILQHATARSLIILDEIGRGTSTYDGLAIAWSVAEYLHDEIGAKTLFATHYHELTELMETMSGVRNFNIAVKEWKDDIIFLRRLVAGPANRSYGIQVGQLAGLPASVVGRAKEILANLEEASHDAGGSPLIARQADGTVRTLEETLQLSLLGSGETRPLPRPAPRAKTTHPVLDELAAVSLDTTTPLEALNLLHKWRRDL